MCTRLNHTITQSPIRNVFFFLRSSRLWCGTDGWNDAIHFYLVVERRDRESESESIIYGVDGDDTLRRKTRLEMNRKYSTVMVERRGVCRDTLFVMKISFFFFNCHEDMKCAHVLRSVCRSVVSHLRVTLIARLATCWWRIDK